MTNMCFPFFWHNSKGMQNIGIPVPPPVPSCPATLREGTSGSVPVHSAYVAYFNSLFGGLVGYFESVCALPNTQLPVFCRTVDSLSNTTLNTILLLLSRRDSVPVGRGRT